MKAFVVLLLLAGLVSARACFTVGESIEMDELDERLVDAVVCGLTDGSNLSISVIPTLLIIVLIALIFYGLMRWTN